MRHVGYCTLLFALSTSCSLPACAQGALRCSAFLHTRDGLWRSFEGADVFGPNGVVHIDNGELLSPSAHSAKGEIARALNDLCDSH